MFLLVFWFKEKEAVTYCCHLGVFASVFTECMDGDINTFKPILSSQTNDL